MKKQKNYWPKQQVIKSSSPSSRFRLKFILQLCCRPIRKLFATDFGVVTDIHGERRMEEDFLDGSGDGVRLAQC